MEIFAALKSVSWLIAGGIALVAWSIRLEMVGKANAANIATHNSRIVKIFETLDNLRVKLEITGAMAERHEVLWSPNELKNFWIEWACLKNDIEHIKKGK